MSRSTFCLKPRLLLKIIWQGRHCPEGAEEGRLRQQWQTQWMLKPSACWHDDGLSPGKSPSPRTLGQLFPWPGWSRSPPCGPASTDGLMLLLSVRGYSLTAPARLFPPSTLATSGCKKVRETCLSVLEV